MHDVTDARLDGLLRRTLREGAERAPLILTPERLAERAGVRAKGRRRRSLTILALAAALLLPVSGLLVAGALTDDPQVDPAPRETYVAVMARIAGAGRLETSAPRDVDVVAVAADGRERTIATIPSSVVPAPWILGGSGGVSADGWLALSLGQPDAVHEAIALVDLRDPSAPAMLVQDPALGIGAGNFGWLPDGRFAILLNDGMALMADPVTNAVARVSVLDPVVYDIRAGNESSAGLLESTAGHRPWRVVEGDVNGRSYGLAVDDPSGTRRVVAWVPVRAGLRDALVSGIAPDESLVTLSVNADAGFGPVILVPTDGRAGTYHEGFPIGFLRLQAVEELGVDGWAEPSDAAPPPVGVPAVPQTAEELAAAWGSPGEPVRLATTHVAYAGADGRPGTWDAGMASLEVGIGFVAACVGPGSMTVQSDIPGVSMAVDCTSGTPANEASPGISINRAVRIRVTADPSTAWSVVVFDPAPGRFQSQPQLTPTPPTAGSTAAP